MKLKLAALAASMSVALLTALPATAADYVIDTKNAHASITFRIKHLGFSWLTGRFDRFSGTFSFDDKNPDASKVKVEIDTASVDTNHAERDKHLRAADLLDTDGFPSATFESTSVKAEGPDKAKITGKLTLHGITKEITIDAARIGGGKDPWGGYRDGFTGTTELTLADFGINRDLGPAAKTIELTLNIEGIRQ
ncbi:YceI family protein [Hyphomicrobium sp.]|uniref:YceI family protein n=1 Tax=Hyphomicrobium sp. TaxID=82 RepID=UPI000F9E4DE2|nr:YceI family protein [Hyphomicrobium sp.]RUP08507.1 MAG: YceI family protein [Hyphomicrobium sp.]